MSSTTGAEPEVVAWQDEDGAYVLKSDRSGGSWIACYDPVEARR